MIEIRYIHFESRRRKKLKILAEYMRNNKQSLVAPGARKDNNPSVQQLTEIHDALRTGSLSQNLKETANYYTSGASRFDMLSHRRYNATQR